MSEIKVGDRVRCVTGEESEGLHVESIHTVVGVRRALRGVQVLALADVSGMWDSFRFVKIEAAAELAPSQGPSEPVAVDTDRVQCTWWERHGFVYDEREQRWVLPPATERAAREADTQAAWDRFAAAAMKGLFAGDTRKTMEPDEVCRLSKECADEMIAHRAASRAAREKGGAQ